MAVITVARQIGSLGDLIAEKLAEALEYDYVDNRLVEEIASITDTTPEEVEAFDEKGDKFNLKVGGLLSRVIQHEYDHLDGIEFTEKITDMRKIMSRGEYLKMMAGS